MGMLSISSLAQAQGSTLSDSFILTMLGVVAIVAVLVLFVAIYVLWVLQGNLNEQLQQKADEEGTTLFVEPGMLSTLMAKLTNRASIEEEETIDLGHDYDGIRELDNHLPPWWKWLFYITIIFGVAYLGYYQFGSGPSQSEEYEMEMAVAAKEEAARQALTADEGGFDESSLVASTDASVLEAGLKIYTRQCAVCHKADGGGSIGPNLTDNYWLHGSSINDIFIVVKNGVPDKGMIAWASMLSPKDMADVSSYILSLYGTNPEGAKEPQGDLVE